MNLFFRIKKFLGIDIGSNNKILITKLPYPVKFCTFSKKVGGWWMIEDIECINHLNIKVIQYIKYLYTKTE